jgi:hypothetical protein
VSSETSILNKIQLDLEGGVEFHFKFKVLLFRNFTFECKLTVLLYQESYAAIKVGTYSLARVEITPKVFMNRTFF